MESIDRIDDDTHGANSVLGKVRLILEAFQIDDSELSLAELTRRSGVPKASVHRLAQELVKWGMLERSGFEYRLGLKAFEIGSRVPRFRVLRDAVRPYLERLHYMTKEVVHLAVRDGLETLYLEKIAPSAQSARASQIAGRMPLHATATGRVFLAFSSPELFQAVVERGLERLTPVTTIIPGILAEKVRTVRRLGWSVEYEEVTTGYCAVGVPIFSRDRTLMGAISVVAPTFRVNLDQVSAALLDVSRRVSSSDMLN